MAKRKTDDELVAELRLYNHFESASRFQKLLEQLRASREHADSETDQAPRDPR
jgi:hypothetical protein